jgi:citrate lyase subunit beta/citryl-CoA lyase
MTRTPGPAILFCPASRPERFTKAAERADAVILDLEDGMAVADTTTALAAIAASGLDPARTLVRVNRNPAAAAAQTEAIRAGGYRMVVVPKCEGVDDLDPWAGFDLVAQVETVAGMRSLEPIAAYGSVFALTWGAEDLIADLGGTSSRGPDGRWRDPLRWMRAQLLIAAVAHSRLAIDAVLSDFSALGLQQAMAADAARSGFAAVACVHPSQVAAIRSGFAPTPDEAEAADAVLAAAQPDGGAVRVGGGMVDAPLVAQARRVARSTDG